MQFSTIAVSLVPFLASSAAALPAANAHAEFVELELPEPRNYIATPIYQGQHIDIEDNRADGDLYTPEAWFAHAWQLCWSNPACSTFSTFHLGPSGIINGTDATKSYWFLDLFAGPPSTAGDWTHFDGAPISNQHIFTITA